MASGGQIARLAIDGLAAGAVYALIALGYTLVYGVLRLVSLAHGEVFMLGAFGGLYAARAALPAGAAGAGPGVLACIGLVAAGTVAGGLAGAVAALGLERAAYRPLRRRGAPRLAYLVSAVGASMFAVSLAGKEFGRRDVPVPGLFTDQTVLRVAGAPVSAETLAVVTAALGLLLAADRLVAWSRLGRSIRAVAQDAECAVLLGVSLERVIVATFVLGGVLAGAGGFLYAMTFHASYTMGYVPGIKAFTAAVLGGLGNVRGALAGGLLLGLVESFGGYYLLDAGYQDVIAFAVLIAVLLLRPSGLLGARLGRPA
ncbi:MULTISPECIES: branched-chain amino acid ABC transporter permease [unclassified Pseudofrankia]|uniref:branched-chain amino acid ABC transporter permease n=1 Tax=unclassified Pseudofrankia TaxID=2994372 RepID=UPI0008D915BD|nr:MULTISPECIES: branched-chain amino acid ABC transporter permease [unclassified Pseudofrankia]MDT3438291.1 branched-chain amino acid ABC transporter permease [Pseudofrankia sp. BMG5.37]OHV46026.1 branched-chain amino acid ABC transporter permease [Pseudofrankia sp. BMG5.36]